jgi:hypothetical protein
MGLSPARWPRKPLVPIVRLATARVARLMVTFDRNLGARGTQEAGAACCRSLFRAHGSRAPGRSLTRAPCQSPQTTRER